MLKRIMIIGGLVVLSGIALGSAGIWYVKQQSSEASGTDAGDSAVVKDNGVALGAVAASPIPLEPSSNSNSTGINAENSNNNTGNSLKVNSNNQNSNNNSNNSGDGAAVSDSAPTLAELGQYGVQYKDGTGALFGDLRKGDGAEAVAGKTVIVDYRGWLTNGQIFDESYKTGRHFSFVLGQGQVISGWEQGINGMKVGGKRRLIVPPAVGYGANAVGGIPPNSLLVFDVELLGVQ